MKLVRAVISEDELRHEGRSALDRVTVTESSMWGLWDNVVLLILS